MFVSWCEFLLPLISSCLSTFPSSSMPSLSLQCTSCLTLIVSHQCASCSVCSCLVMVIVARCAPRLILLCIYVRLPQFRVLPHGFVTLPVFPRELEFPSLVLYRLFPEKKAGILEFTSRLGEVCFWILSCLHSSFMTEP